MTRPLMMTSLMLFLAAVGVLGCSEAENVDEPTPRVKVFTVGEKATGQSRRISGQVKAADRSELGFGVSGRVAKVIVSKGQVVTKGQLLATLDDEPFQLRVDEARAKLGNARAMRVDAKTVYDRQKSLLEQTAASKRDFDAATAALATATGDVDAAKKQLGQAEFDLSRTRLKAPFAGRMVEMPLDPFQEVSANDTAAIIQTEGIKEVDVLVPETLIRELDYGQAVQVTFPTLEGVTVEGVVTLIGAEAGVGNAFPVTIRLAPSEADLRPGMTASVTFNFAGYLDGKTAYLIPLSAIAIDAGLNENRASHGDKPGKLAPVFLFDPETKKVVTRKVRVGDLRGNQVEVFEGLEPGDLVVSAGLPFIREGMAAEVWTPRQGAGQ